MARRRRRAMHLNAEINVVSLIDVMLILLVIFMLTAPMMQGGVDIKLPAADAKPLETKSALVISVDKGNMIHINDGPPMTYDAFDVSVGALVKRYGKSGVDFQGDSRIGYGIVAQVMTSLSREGVQAIGFAVVPRSNK